MRKSVINIFIIFTCLSYSSCFMGFPKRDNNINNYNKYRDNLNIAAKEVLPEISNILTSTKIIFKYRYDPVLIFASESVSLITEYNEQTYFKEKAKIQLKYSFIYNPVIDYFGHTSITETKFNINSYTFHLLKTENSIYPKSFGFIAFSDEKKSIAYLYFNDIDYDIIESPTKDFIYKYFKYKW